jgi:hypothetical protein
VTTTLAPSPPNRSAIALPMPLLLPVTIATLLFNRCMCSPHKNAPSKLACFSTQEAVWIYPLLRASTEHILIVRGLRAGGIDQTPI